MSGYLNFNGTGIEKIDAIVNTLNTAGHMFHHTEGWHDAIDWEDGQSYHELIQDVLDLAAKEIESLKAQLNDAIKERDQYNYKYGECRAHYADLKGQTAGKVCFQCNFIERSACYENHMKLEAQLAECRDKALEEAAHTVEYRGKQIGGAIQPDRTAEAIRSLKGENHDPE